MVEQEEAENSKSNGQVVSETTNQETVRLVQVDSSMGDHECRRDETLYVVFNRIFTEIFFPETKSSDSGASLFKRIKISVSENSSSVRDASRNSVRSLIRWTRRGGPFRALLVISVGTIMLLALTGLLVFMLFFLAATTNAIIISLLMSLAAAGGFLALFFACMTAIYIGALSVAVFVISGVTIATMIAVVITTGWIGFFLTVWLVTKKSFGLAKYSLNTTGSALSAYSSARHARRQEMNKASN